MHDSIPHLWVLEQQLHCNSAPSTCVDRHNRLAGLTMRILSTGWSAYSIWRTIDIHERFQVLITYGPCQVDLFPSYFRLRGAIQIADLALNVVALAASCYLVWHLVKAYATSMFKRVGAPDHVIKLYGVCIDILYAYPYDWQVLAAIPRRTHLSATFRLRPCNADGLVGWPVD